LTKLKIDEENTVFMFEVVHDFEGNGKLYFTVNGVRGVITF
jgi:hypothetical protein